MSTRQEPNDRSGKPLRFKITPGALRHRADEYGISSDDYSVEFGKQTPTKRHDQQVKPGHNGHKSPLKSKKPGQGYNNFTIPLDVSHVLISLGPPTDGSGKPLPASSSEDDDRLFQDHIYLFNVIVALEWQPTKRYLRLLKAAFQNASDFLYDVTDGYMAFGQVIIGGMELMDCADIQILASNRLNPRSWVNALHEPLKYTPIRVGRGVWHKNSRVSIPWDEPEGYRTLIHEWAHYALGLRDEYLQTHQVVFPTDSLVARQSSHLIADAPHTLVIPGISLATESIMGSLEGTSELVPQASGSSVERRLKSWNVIVNRYSKVTTQPPGLIGPHRLPIGLPSFPKLVDDAAPQTSEPMPMPSMGDANASESASQAGGSGATSALPAPIPAAEHDELIMTLPTNIMAEHCWVYVVKGRLDAPAQLIAQGTLDARALCDGFRLLNASPNDHIILIGKHLDGHSIVLQGEITGIAPISDNNSVPASKSNGTSAIDRHERRALVQWQPDPVTPSASPLVDVIPAPVDQDYDATAQIQVRITSEQLPTLVYLFPLGQPSHSQRFEIIPAPNQAIWWSPRRSIATLDGHLYLRWPDGTLAIYTFSQGGGPATHVAAQYSPITAGSAEGNVMLFFKDEDSNPSYSAIRAVTTLIHDMPQAARDSEANERSYIFSIASNQALPVNLAPTLVMYYDTHAVRNGGDLVIHRLEDTTWRAMPTYLPLGSSFAAMPLNKDTAPLLVGHDARERVEHYRLYWIPWKRSGSDSTAVQVAVSSEQRTG